MVEKPKCKNCIFWKLEDEENNIGTCRVNAPPLVNSNGFANFPKTYGYEFCGEFSDEIEDDDDSIEQIEYIRRISEALDKLSNMYDRND